MRYSILLPVGPVRPEQVVPFANLVRWAGADRLWQGQGMAMESQHLIAWLSGLGIRVPAGFGVSLMPLRSPYHAAIEARSVAMTTGHSVIAGFGTGSTAMQRKVLGQPYRSQLTASREYIQIVRGLLNGEQVELDGQYHRVDAALQPALAPPVLVGLGALRPKMAAVAGEVADVAITWMGSAEYLATTIVPAVRGATRGIAEPARITAIVPVGLAGPDRDVTELAAAACGGHIQLPHYQQTLRTAGIEVSDRPGPADIAKLIDAGIFVSGTVEDIHRRLDEYRLAGVDEVVLNASGVGQVEGAKAAAEDLLAILRSMPAE